MALLDKELSEQFAAILFWLIILTPIGDFARQIQQVRRGARRRSKGTIMFFPYSIHPVLTYGLVFLVLVGVEDLTTLSVITEGFARSLLRVVGIESTEVLLVTVIFAVAIWFMRVPENAANQPIETGLRQRASPACSAANGQR